MTERSEGHEDKPDQPRMTERTERSERTDGLAQPDGMRGAPDYRTVLRRLAALDAEAADLRTEAQRWHDDRLAAVDRAERSAQEAVRHAEQAVRAARRDLEEVDARAARLWSDFVHRVGPSAERFGRTVPEPRVPHQRTEGPEHYLQEVSTRLAYTPPARPLTTTTRLLFGLLGALGGLLGVGLALMLRWAGREAGGDWAVGLPVLALIMMLIGPVVGVAGAKRVADRRAAALDAAAVAVVLVTGLLTTALCYAALRAG